MSHDVELPTRQRRLAACLAVDDLQGPRPRAALTVKGVGRHHVIVERCRGEKAIDVEQNALRVGRRGDFHAHLTGAILHTHGRLHRLDREVLGHAQSARDARR